LKARGIGHDDIAAITGLSAEEVAQF